MNKISVFILGAGGHSKVLIDSLRFKEHIQILGVLDIDPQLMGKKILGVNVLGSEHEILKQYLPHSVQLVNGIGSVGPTVGREQIFQKFKSFGYSFLTIIHPTAYVGQEVILGEGVQLMAGSIVQPGSEIGDNVIINTNASVDHDSFIGNHVHLAPGVICCGSVKIDSGTHAGCGVVIRQGVHIGKNSFIAAGAVVVKDINVGSKVAGVPAKSME